MKFLFMLAIILTICTSSFCQSVEINERKDTTFESVQQMPSFPGGEIELYNYLASNMRYPDSAKILGLQGKIYVEFVVCKTGKICDFKICKGNIGKGCEEEAIRVLKGMPDWIPGKHNGENVNVKFRLPIHFTLNGTTIKKDTIYDSVQQMPSFPGGEEELYKFLGSNMIYPENARQSELHGKLIVEFVVSNLGKIKDVKISNGYIGGGCEEEAIRLIKIMPDWIPGKQNDKPVNVYFRMPFIFSINNSGPEKLVNLNVDISAKYAIGDSAMYQFLFANLKQPNEIKQNPKAIIYADFVVSNEGRIHTITIYGNVNCKDFSNEIIRVIEKMPNWIPAKIKEEDVSSKCRMLIYPQIYKYIKTTN